MATLKLRVLVGLCIFQFAATMLPMFAQDLPSLQSRVPKSDPKKYQGILDAKDWKNPQLIVRPTGVEIIGITPAGSAIPVDSVLDVLEHLPHSAWPYGLVVAVSDVGQHLGIEPVDCLLQRFRERKDIAAEANQQQVSSLSDYHF